MIPNTTIKTKQPKLTSSTSPNNIYQTPQLQYDSQGYVKSFDLNTATNQQLQTFYHKYGFIIFKNILTQPQIQKTIDDLWNSTTKYYKQTRNKVIDRNKMETWDFLGGFQRAFGFVNDGILQQPQIWQNRKNQKVYKAFKRSYQANTLKPLKQPLIASFDRGSLMLPSKLNPQWRTDDIYHFDIDPWLWTNLTHDRHTKYDYDPDRMNLLLGQGNYDPYVGYTKLAGVIALSNTNQNSGGFACACGFQNYIHNWCKKNRVYTRIQKDKNLVGNFRKIFMRKGDILIFSRQLPHNIYQNDSENFRYAQYVRMSPLSALCLTPQLIEARKKLVCMILPKNLDVSDAISKEIFMLDGTEVIGGREQNQVKNSNPQEVQMGYGMNQKTSSSKKKQQSKTSKPVTRSTKCSIL